MEEDGRCRLLANRSSAAAADSFALVTAPDETVEVMRGAAVRRYARASEPRPADADLAQPLDRVSLTGEGSEQVCQFSESRP